MRESSCDFRLAGKREAIAITRICRPKAASNDSPPVTAFGGRSQSSELRTWSAAVVSCTYSTTSPSGWRSRIYSRWARVSVPAIPSRRVAGDQSSNPQRRHRRLERQVQLLPDGFVQLRQQDVRQTDQPSVITSKAANSYHFKTGQRKWPSRTENVLSCRLLRWQVGFGAPAPRAAFEHVAVVQ